MSGIPYNIVKKVDPRDPSKPMKYFAAAHLKKTTSLRDLVNRISQYSTVNPPDVMAVLESIYHIVPELAMKGEIVRLGDFGSFYITIQSTGSENSKGVSNKGIKQAMIRFRAGKLIKRLINNVGFQKIT